jgi:Tol biopolymer transport system component
MRRAILLAAALVGLVLVPAGHVAATPGTKIVFESYRDGDYEIYAVDPQTLDLTKLTNNDYEDSSPTPSPDGTKVAFYSAIGTSVVNVDGSNRRLLVGCTGYNLSWSPDSSQVVCEGSDGLTIVNADGTGAKTITASDFSASAPSWSPDGKTIAFVGANGVWKIDPAGGLPQLITAHHASDLALPSWSPDSSTIAFVSEEPSTFRNDLYVVHPDGSGLRQLDPNIGDYRPFWSPDGTQIAYTGTVSKYVSGAYVISPGGTGKTLLSGNSQQLSALEPSWSPDGSQVVYTRGRFSGYGGDGDLFVVDRTGGTSRPVTTPFPAGATNDAPSWAPGPLEGGNPPLPVHWLKLPAGQALGGRPVLAAVYADGKRATVVRQAGCALLAVWTPGARKLPTINPCGEGDDFLLEVGVAGSRVGWINALQSLSEFDQSVNVWEPGRGSATITFAQADPETGAGDFVGNIVGHGSVLVFNFWSESSSGRISNMRLYRILPRGARAAKRCPYTSGFTSPGKGAKRCMRLRAADGFRALSAGTDTIVGVEANGTLGVFRGNGRLVRRFSFKPGEVLGAQAEGQRLVVLTATTLVVYDTRTGAKVKTLQLAQSTDWPAPQLFDFYGNYVLYGQGAVHLLRITDGRDLLLQVGAQAPPAWAQLEPAGLFYLYNQLYAKHPGRVVFVPYAKLVAAVNAAS